MRRTKHLFPFASLWFLLGAFALGGGSVNDSWPRYRGAAFNGISGAKGLFHKGYGLKIAWKKDLGSGYSSISLASWVAVTMFSDGKDDFMIALDASSGDEEWRYRIAETHRGDGGSDSGPLSTPTIDGHHVFGLGPHGHLFALDLKTGKEIWALNLAEDLKAVKPLHGFATSPLVAGNTLVVQTGSEQGAITGFNKYTGKQLWSAGNLAVNYQSPILTELLGTRQLICGGDKKLIGLDPANGKLLWEYPHGGSRQDYSPVMVGKDAFFVRNNNWHSVLIRASKQAEGYKFKEAWKSRDLKRSNNDAVFYRDHLYGFSGAFLTCVEASTGRLMWKSRPPGEGFIILVDGHLAVITTVGTLHLIEATHQGYREKANLRVFSSKGWNPPAYANGKIYVRNHASIAAVEVGRKVTDSLAVKPAPYGIVPGTKLAAWVAEVEKVRDKKRKIDEFMASQKSFPIIEGPVAHVIYRGEASDIAISGDHLPMRVTRPMNRVAGTDLHYYSIELEEDAHIAYKIVVDFENFKPDPLNKYMATNFGSRDVHSLLAMSKWSDSNHLQKAAVNGKLMQFEFESKITNNKRGIQVYLPPDYENSEQRYPVVYVSLGSLAVLRAAMPNSLDNLIGKSVAPLIAVFVDLSPITNLGEIVGASRNQYARMLAEELVPHIDSQYRTRTEREARAVWGAGTAGYPAIYTAITYPDVFSMAVSQSANLHGTTWKSFSELMSKPPGAPVRLVMEWGRYDRRNADLKFDIPAKNLAAVKIMKEKGYQIEGGEIMLGTGWGNWRTRNDDILRLLFPMDSNNQ